MFVFGIAAPFILNFEMCRSERSTICYERLHFFETEKGALVKANVVFNSSLPIQSKKKSKIQ